MLVMLVVITSLSTIEYSAAVSCIQNVSTFTIELRNNFTETPTKELNTSAGIHVYGSECAGGKRTDKSAYSIRIFTYV